MTSVNHQNLTAKNAEYAASFKDGDLELPPTKKYAIVTCMDARIDPAAAFGIPLGTAHVIRNAGGSACDALRSLLISQHLPGTTEIFLVKHTDCGMLTFTNESARETVGKYLGEEAAEEVKDVNFRVFEDLEREVVRDVKWLRGRKAVASSVGVSGWVYDVKTGVVREVEGAKVKGEAPKVKE